MEYEEVLMQFNEYVQDNELDIRQDSYEDALYYFINRFYTRIEYDGFTFYEEK